MTLGAFGVRKSKIWNNYQTGGPIGTKFGTHVRNGWINWHQLWQTRADSSRNGNGRNKKLPHVTLGAFGVRKSKIWNNYQTSGPIGTKFGTHVRIHLGMDIG